MRKNAKLSALVKKHTLANVKRISNSRNTQNCHTKFHQTNLKNVSLFIFTGSFLKEYDNKRLYVRYKKDLRSV